MAARTATEPGHSVAIPLPPTYGSCVKVLQAEANGFGAGPPPSPVHLKSKCASSYKEYLKIAMTKVLSTAWVTEGARKEGIRVTPEEDRHTVERGLSSLFRTREALLRYLKSAGETPGDMLFSAEIGLLSEKIRAKINSTLPTVTPQTIERYYLEHKARYTTPEERDLGIVHTKSKQLANQAVRELRAGVSFPTVTKRLVTEAQPPLAREGLLVGFKEGTFAPDQSALTKAILATPVHSFGPIVNLKILLGYHSRFHRNPADIQNIGGYYVFQVEAIRPERTKPLSAVKAELEKTLPEAIARRALVKYIAAWRARLRKETDCSPGYVVRKCRQYKPTPGEEPEDPYTLN